MFAQSMQLSPAPQTKRLETLEEFNHSASDDVYADRAVREGERPPRTSRRAHPLFFSWEMPPRRPLPALAACLTVLLALLLAFAAPQAARAAGAEANNAAIARTAGIGHHHQNHHQQQRGHSIRARCALTKGHWCSRFFLEPLVPLSPTLPAFNATACADPDCNGVGVCNARTGLCDCPAGMSER